MNVQTAEGLVDFGECLERECSEIGQSRPTPCNAALTCTAARTLLPPAIAASLFTAAQIMVRWAYEAVERGPGGRIGVSFRVAGHRSSLRSSTVTQFPGTLCARIATAHCSCSRPSLLLAVTFEARQVIGGCRWVIVIPRSLSSANTCSRSTSVLRRAGFQHSMRP